MKNIFSSLILLTSLNTFSQELVNSTNFKIPKKSDFFQVIEEDSKNVTFFFSSKRAINSVRFNPNFEIIDSLSIAKTDKELKDIIGYSIVGGKYYTFWSTSDDNEIVSKCFDYNNKIVSNHNHKLDFIEEKAIKKITINNVFYLITLSKNSSILNFHRFAGNQYDKKTLNLNEQKFYDFKDSKTNLWEIFSFESILDLPMTLQTISDESPASLVFTSSKKKCYNLDDHFIITLDNNTKVTQYIKINLSDFTYSFTIFKQPKIIENSDYISNSNSFLIDNGIIQMKTNSKNMEISYKGMDNIEKKSYSILKDKEITFKNSEIYQENKSVKSTRVLDKSNQLLRKIHSSNPSISCYNNNGVIYLTIGSASIEENNNAVMIGAILGGLSGALIGAALSSNYSINNVNSYQNRKVVYINSLFDSNFNHISGDAKKLAFDKLRVFVEENSHLDYKTVFKLNKNLYFSGLDRKTNNYSFYKFTD